MKEKTTIQKIRRSILDAIKGILVSHGVTSVLASDLDEGSAPVIRDDQLDANDSFVLDSVTLKDGSLSFAASSCWRETVLDEEDMDTDALCGILDWLRSHEGALPEKENAEGQEPSSGPDEAGRHLLRVIFGEHASRFAANNGYDRAAEMIGSCRLDGSCCEYTFDTARDRDVVQEILDAADGWLGTYYESK